MDYSRILQLDVWVVDPADVATVGGEQFVIVKKYRYLIRSRLRLVGTVHQIEALAGTEITPDRSRLCFEAKCRSQHLAADADCFGTDAVLSGSYPSTCPVYVSLTSIVVSPGVEVATGGWFSGADTVIIKLPVTDFASLVFSVTFTSTV